jgi:hypothetical protein
MLGTLYFFLFKMPFISYATFFGSCIIRFLHTLCAKIYMPNPSAKSLIQLLLTMILSIEEHIFVG